MTPKRNQRILLFLFCSILLCGSSCDPGFVSGGFSVRTEETVGISVFGFPLQTYTPFTGISGRMAQALTGASGTVTIFDLRSGIDGIAFVGNGRVPAIWHLFFTSGPCLGAIQPSPDPVINPGDETEWVCINERANSFGISPESVNGLYIPQLTITVQEVDATYGTPQIWILNEAGAVVYSSDATSYDVSNNWAAVMGVPTLVSGNYAVLVRTVQADGSLLTVGGAGLVVYGNDPPPPDLCSSDPTQPACIQNDN
jgi:hypothetical protein